MAVELKILGDFLRLFTAAHVRWNSRVSNDGIRRRVLGDCGIGTFVKVTMNLHRLRWFDHVPDCRASLG